LHHPLFQQASHLPTIITGDFNDWRNTLGRHAFHPQRFRQATDPIRQFRSFPAFLALASLDKAYYRGGVEVRQARVVQSRLARRASDHLPLVLELHLREERGASAVVPLRTG
jgi:endonuclease/exonuclease/phosphatase family metal-dependent hydrolase